MWNVFIIIPVGWFKSELKTLGLSLAIGSLRSTTRQVRRRGVNIQGVPKKPKTIEITYVNI